MATRKRKKLSNTTMLFIVIAITLAIIIISGGMPQAAEFFKPGNLQQVKIPAKSLAPPLPKPPVQEATTRFAYYNATAKQVYVLDAKDDGTPVGNSYPVTRTGLYNPLPSLSHDGQKLIFVRQLNGGIFLTNLSCPEAKSGCPAAQLILPGPAYDAEWSPDDSKILYLNLSLTENSIGVYTFATNSSTLVYDANKKLGAKSPVFPTWANLGNNIVFVVNYSSMYVVPATCNNACAPTFLRAVSNAIPRGYWRGIDVAYRDLQSENIYVAPFDSSKESRYVVHKGEAPAWSPNGQWIAYYNDTNVYNRILSRVNFDCNQGINCNIKTIMAMGSDVEVFDWQQIGLSPPLPKAMSGCQIINQSGTYILTKDVTASYLGKDKACFNITTSNVVLDCQGHTVTGPYYVGGSDPSGTSSAVFIQGDKNSNTIKNCNIKNFGHGVFMLAGEEPINNGVEIRSPKNNIVTGNTFTDNSNSIQITGGAMSCAGEPSGNLIYNNRFFSTQSFYRHAGSITSANCPAFAKFDNGVTGNCWDDYSSGDVIPYGTFVQGKKTTITPDSAADYKPVTCGPRPDLIVKDLTFTSTNLKVGDTVYINVTFCNVGNANAGTFGVRVIDLSENNGMAGGFAELFAGDCRTMGGYWPLTIAGEHTVRAIVDNANQIDESDETNNILEKNITVSGNMTATATIIGLETEEIQYFGNPPNQFTIKLIDAGHPPIDACPVGNAKIETNFGGQQTLQPNTPVTIGGATVELLETAFSRQWDMTCQINGTNMSTYCNYLGTAYNVTIPSRTPPNGPVRVDVYVPSWGYGWTSWMNLFDYRQLPDGIYISVEGIPATGPTTIGFSKEPPLRYAVFNLTNLPGPLNIGGKLVRDSVPPFGLMKDKSMMLDGHNITFVNVNSPKCDGYEAAVFGVDGTQQTVTGCTKWIGSGVTICMTDPSLYTFDNIAYLATSPEFKLRYAIFTATTGFRPLPVPGPVS